MPEYLPIAPPQWATDATYPAGADPWSGGPVRIAPSSGQIAAGFAPNTQPPAEFFNYQLGASGDAMRLMAHVQAHNALQTWRFIDLVPYTADVNQLVEIVGMLPIVGYTDLHGDRQRSIVALTTVSAPSPRAGVPRSYDGGQWETNFGFAITPVLTTPTSLAAGAPGALLALQATPGFNYSTDQGNTWANTSFGPSGNLQAHYSAGLAKYFMATTGGDVSVATTLPTFAAGVLLPGSSGVLAGPVSFADNGSTVVVCGKPNGSANSTIWRSVNSGTSWTAALTGLIGSANVVYHAALGLFVAISSDGLVFTSPDAATWTNTSSSATGANNFAFGANTLASAGRAIVHSVAVATGWAGGSHGNGIAYSFDLGATWNYSLFGLFENVKLRGINGRIYAYDSRHLWISERITAPLAEI
jgi:hypothetical protein